MRDIFEDLFANQPLDPMEAARRGMRPNARRRFYAAASTRPEEGGYAVLLDGRIVRTPARHALAAPSEALAEAIAAEWEGQGEMIDPAKMPLTRLANTIIDGVTTSIDAVTAEIEKYLATDLVFYRAEGPDRLVARQRELWDAILAWARIALGARFELVEGVIHIAQPEQSLRTAAARDPARSLAARRRACRHDLDRLGPDRARTRAGRLEPRRGLDRGACRRGLEHGAVGARRDRARASRVSICRDAGGSDGDDAR